MNTLIKENQSLKKNLHELEVKFVDIEGTLKKKNLKDYVREFTKLISDEFWTLKLEYWLCVLFVVACVLICCYPAEVFTRRTLILLPLLLSFYLSLYISMNQN